MNIFNKEEFQSLCRQFDQRPYIKEVTIKYGRKSFFDKMRKSIALDRRGEVVFCVIRPNGKIITVTCEEYPPGIFRIPTGGIGHNEDILQAVQRETLEELGLHTRIKHFLGALKIKFSYNSDSVMFYSYLFILEEISGKLLLDASDNEVSEVKEVNVHELKEVCDALRLLEGDWSDWGKFRYLTCQSIYDYLKY